jgi:hypothetical protein
VVSFETWGVWRRGDQPYGELTQTQEQVKQGGYSAKLTYEFPDVADDYVVFVQPQAIAGQPDTLSAWVYGDGSGQYLNLWIKDAQGEIWSVHMGTIGAAGWQILSGRLAPGQPWPSGRIGGPDNGAIDYPVQFYALVLDRPAANASKGTIYIDEISASTQGAGLPGMTPRSAVAPRSAVEPAMVLAAPAIETLPVRWLM